jgi:hypothetical protein
MQGKLNNRGTSCMVVGYAVHHAKLNEVDKDWIARKVESQFNDNDLT